MGTHGSAVMEANTPQGPGDPITAGALLSPQELPLSSLGLQSQPRISRSPERAGYGCKTTTKSDASPGVSTEASRAGPAHQEGRFLAQHYERERVSPSLTSPGTLQEPAGFTGERIQTHSPPGGSGHGAPVAPIGGQGPLPWA